MRLLSIALLVTFAAGFQSRSPAEETVKLPDEYRVIVCSAAVDLSSPLHELALRVVEKQRFSEPKFDDFIRQTLGSEDLTAQMSDHDIEAVRSLMPFCEIPRDERVSLLLDQIEGSAAMPSIGSFSRSEINLADNRQAPERIAIFAKLVQHYQIELLAELKKRLDVDHPHWSVASAVNLLKIDGHELLPMLMKAAKSDDVELQFAAIDAINQLRLPQSDADLDPRTRDRSQAMTKVAEKMIPRYDIDGDKRLDASEWSNMLQPPGDADTDQDGFVTIEEYARWLELKSQRRQP